MSDVKFKEGDRVRWGDDLGRVSLSWDNGDFNVVFDCAPRAVVSFKADGSLSLSPVGVSVGPRVERVERPKQKRKVWKWERVFKYDSGLSLEQSSTLFGEEGWHAKNGWTKVPGSEREIEVEDGE